MRVIIAYAARSTRMRRFWMVWRQLGERRDKPACCRVEVPIEIATVYDSAAVIEASYLSDRFAAGLPYDRYVQTGTDEQQRRWSQVYDAARLTDTQKQLVGGFVREMKILIFSGIWCGDCVEQCPLIQRIAQANTSKIDLRFIERPKDGELVPELRINGGSRVPSCSVLVRRRRMVRHCRRSHDQPLSRHGPPQAWPALPDRHRRTRERRARCHAWRLGERSGTRAIDASAYTSTSPKIPRLVRSVVNCFSSADSSSTTVI